MKNKVVQSVPVCLHHRFDDSIRVQRTDGTQVNHFDANTIFCVHDLCGFKGETHRFRVCHESNIRTCLLHRAYIAIGNNNI